jgi:G3E family GTPase
MKKKIYFFNGALGSGKTTLINQLIKADLLGKFFIIENEIASLGIDNQCLHLDPKQIKVLAGECICCSDPKELLQLLKNIGNSTYENVVIESSGATSLNQLLVNILVDRELAEIYEIGGCVFLVDALGIERTSVFDLEVSDFVIVTKFDALKNMQQFEKLDKFIKEDYKDVTFYVKNFEDSTEWMQKLLDNRPKTFREWALRINNEKHHGSNFVKILSGEELKNFQPEKAYAKMNEKEIVRIKGFYLKNDLIMHIEMTPEQMKEQVESAKPAQLGVVVIGRNKFLLDEFVNSVI